MDKRFQRQGIAYEVCEKIIELARDRFGVERLYLVTNRENMPSVSLAKKLGFDVYWEDTTKDSMDIYVSKLT